MEDRSREEVQASFDKMIKRLDQSLLECQNRLISEEVIIDDCSNRSGFCHTGFLNYTWSYCFIHDIKKQPVIERALVLITYREPSFVNQKPEMTILKRSEKFTLGAPSFFFWEETEHIDFSLISTLNLYDLIKTSLNRAEDTLGKK